MPQQLIQISSSVNISVIREHGYKQSAVYCSLTKAKVTSLEMYKQWQQSHVFVRILPCMSKNVYLRIYCFVFDAGLDCRLCYAVALPFDK